MQAQQDTLASAETATARQEAYANEAVLRHGTAGRAVSNERGCLRQGRRKAGLCDATEVGTIFRLKEQARR